MPAWELANITARLVLPPGALLLLGLIGLALVRSRMRYGAGLALFALLALYVLSMPIVARTLLQELETPYTDPLKDRTPGAIVVLGGGSYVGAPEYGGDTVSNETLERLRYAAHLQHRTGKPVLVTSGNPLGAQTSEAEQMKSALRDFGVTPKWVEAGSNNTFENARFTQKMLRQAGVDSIYLVTHAWHMPRAKMAFERAGLRVVPAAMAFQTHVRVMPLDFAPSTSALHASWLFFHEIAGIAWYRMRFARES